MGPDRSTTLAEASTSAREGVISKRVRLRFRTVLKPMKISLKDLAVRTKPSRAHAGRALELPAKVTLIRESGLDGDVRERTTRISEQIGGTCEPQTPEVLADRQPLSLTK